LESASITVLDTNGEMFHSQRRWRWFVRLILRSIRERTLSVITDSIRYAAGIRTEWATLIVMPRIVEWIGLSGKLFSNEVNVYRAVCNAMLRGSSARLPFY